MESEEEEKITVRLSIVEIEFKDKNDFFSKIETILSDTRNTIYGKVVLKVQTIGVNDKEPLLSFT